MVRRPNISRPDFYLPDDDMFIEITTMNQKFVTKKNKKVKRLQAIHPDVNCKVFYQRDYLQLVVKYGLEEPDHLAESVAPDAYARGTRKSLGSKTGENVSPGELVSLGE